MPPRRRIDPTTGHAALAQWRADPGAAAKDVVATAVRFTLEELSIRTPGRAVEVRVPPFGAVQVIPGPTHTRGTPPAVVEMEPATWLSLVIGQLSWAHACTEGAVRASGTRADLAAHLPLWDGSTSPD